MAAYPNNKKDDPAEFEDVYAGPGMWDGSGDEPEVDPETEPEIEPEVIPEPPKAEEEEKREPKPFEGVYAGPGPIGRGISVNPNDRPAPDPRMFMTVYGGPDYFANPNRPAPGSFALPPEEEEKKEEPKKPEGYETKKCSACGAYSAIGSKFCPECGKPFPSEFCPACGTKTVENANFCHACGAKLPR